MTGTGTALPVPSADGRAPGRRRLPPPQACLVALGVALGGAGAGLLAVLPPAERAGPPASLGLLALVGLLFVTAESSQIHVEVRRQTFSVSLSELPLVLGLFLLPPAGLLGARLVAATAVFVARRTAPAKTAFNLGLFTAEVGLAVLVFRLLKPGAGLVPRDWAIAYVATLVVDILGPAAVVGAMSLLQGRLATSRLGQMLPPIALAGAMNTTLALISLMVVHVSGTGIVLLAVLAALVAAAYRAYHGLLRRHADLGQLFAFTQTVGAADTTDTMVTQLLAQARDLLAAESAVLRLPPDRAQTGAEEPPPLPPGPLVIPRGTKDPMLRAWLAHTGLTDALLVPLRDDGNVVGVLQVGNRLGAMSTFTSDDLRLLQTLTAHAELVWHNGRLLERLRYDAQHDALTGLANRSLFLVRLQERLRACAQHPTAVEAAVLLLDLDRFKDVNDTLGHHVGDLLLRQVASRLESQLPADAVVARLGGDEFAVLVERCDSAEAAMALAGAARDALTGRFEVAGTFLEVGASIGVAMVPADGRDPPIVLQRADVAMYRAKSTAAGVARYRSDDHSSSLHRLALAAELRQAVSSGELVVHFQPQAELGSGAVVGFEALVRWQHPRRGLIMPDDFVPIAEQTGLIGALTEEVLRQALLACRGWLSGSPGTGVAVNLSARGLLEPGLLATVARLLAESEVPPARLTLEITESSVMDDFAGALAVLEQLCGLGVRLSVDDFGTGYSSLAYLQRLPVHEVKIDKSFVIQMSVNPGDGAIVRAIVDLAHTLSLAVVAEGVEDERSRHALAVMRCDTMQGYLLSRPLTPEQLPVWRAAYRAQPAVTGRAAHAPRLHVV